MVELIICNNDGMAEGAVSALQGACYNTGDGKTIPVFGVDATDSAKQLINEGKMTGTIKQDAAVSYTHLDVYKRQEQRRSPGSWAFPSPTPTSWCGR